MTEMRRITTSRRPARLNRLSAHSCPPAAGAYYRFESCSDMHPVFENEPAVAWIAMPYRARVVTADGSDIGPAESLLGDEKEDIFHGIVVKRSADRKSVEIPAARIKKITAGGVLTDLTSTEVPALQPYRAEHWYHLGWGGVFRKHPRWDETSNP